MQQTGKYIIVTGFIIVIIGVILFFAGDRMRFIGRLPGDIHIEKENFNFYFPLTTCILISLMVTLIIWLIKYIKQ